MVALFATGLIAGPERIKELISSFSESPWGALAFVALYMMLTILMAPGAVSSIAGGAIFGFAAGFGLVLIGATLGAVGAFFISRKVGQKPIQALLGDRTKSLDGWIGENGLVAVLLLRQVPIVPFNVLNYAAGLSSVDSRSYTIGTFFGIIPGVAVFVWIGSSASDPSDPKFALSLAAFAVLIVVGSLGAKRMKANQAKSVTQVQDV